MFSLKRETALQSLGSLNHHLVVGVFCLRSSLQVQLEYPLFLVSWFLMIPIQYFGGVWMLKVLADRFSNLGGWTFPELVFLFGLGLLSHALTIIFFIQTWSIEDLVLRGGFDRLMVRPLNVLFHFFVSGINLIGAVDLIPAIITFTYGCSLLGIGFSWKIFFSVIAVVLGAMLIRASIYLGLASVAFWTKKSRPLVMGAMMVMDRTTSYPQSIYPYSLQVLLTFLVPIGFIAFYPAAELLHKTHMLAQWKHVCFLSLGIGLATFALAHSVFKFGLRRYESAGS
jgi:ABC-2 type transport system permease protein